MINIPETSTSIVLYQPPSTGQLINPVSHKLPRELRFYMVDSGGVLDKMLDESLRKGWVLGRHGKGVHVDVDLAPFRAVEMGVSREHLRIELVGERLMLRDEGAANGTRLNGQRMQVHHVYELHHGDYIQLGMLLLQISFIAA